MPPPRSMRLRRVAIVCALVVALPGPAAAGASPLGLQWVAPDGCPSPAQVAADVERLGGSGRTGMRFTVVATRAAAGTWQATIETGAAGGKESRVLEGESCEAVAEATALFVALALGSEGGTAEPANAAPTEEAANPVASPVAPSTASPAAAGSPTSDRAATAGVRSSPPFAIRASSRFDSATLPRPIIGAELSVGFRARPVLVELAATYWAPESAALAGAPPMGGRYSMLTGTVRACDENAISSFAIGPCLGGGVDRIDADGNGSGLTAGSGSTAWFAVEAGGFAAWRPARWIAVKGLVDANVPFARPSFVVKDATASYRVPLASLRASLGFELEIP